jgi:hypothetical protein
MPLDHVDLLDQDAILLLVDAQDLADLALVLSGQDLDLVVLRMR